MIEVKLKLDMSGLSNLDNKVKARLARGVSHGSEVLKENILEDHGLGSHSKDRWERKSGEFARGTQQMPVTIDGDEIKAGVITRVDYAVPLEEGHDIKVGGKTVGHVQAYPAYGPALENKELQDEILDIVADELSKEF